MNYLANGQLSQLSCIVVDLFPARGSAFQQSKSKNPSQDWNPPTPFSCEEGNLWLYRGTQKDSGSRIRIRIKEFKYF
jgi:hypothetical protein